ncbi:FeoC-like transcriptional regulator [Nitrogeniibacter mangrovi]|uniref:FeoC-like transcriptional regulator n=1 Tax=Nitrogeniibacter mangrovi TaxID=2016596 RepID=UPI001E3EDD28|nr:FeoC-like transcriptional regulator [Nitrogeniibacter mangrovi]
MNRLRDTLKQRERASVQELSLALGMTPDALRAMLDTLERKGRVHKLPAQTNCGDCCKCNPDTLDVYAWSAPR